MDYFLECGDVVEICSCLPDDFFHGCLTDPPYGLEFMGKEWDKVVPGVDVWREVKRVLKPGAFMLVFGGTRTFHRMACAIEDSGFEIRDCMMWLYGSGFPKSLDISKAIDKAAGAERTEVIGARHRNVKPFNDEKGWNQNGTTGDFEYTAPATPEAARWSGYGTALKPAWEPIIVAMKPCDGTFAGNALKWGVAGLNVDAGRIPTNDSLGGGGGFAKSEGWNRPWMNDPVASAMHCERVRANVEKAETLGRWPANLILDPESAAMLDQQSGITTSTGGQSSLGAFRNGDIYGKGQDKRWKANPGKGDTGGASRFFYCAKPSKRERGSFNSHPTVKPVSLTEYLARLILPPGEESNLLVPFCGSGSEIIGARKAGWEYIYGIDNNQEYLDIAEKRLA